MIRINVFVEGQTEETFVRELLYGYFQEKNIFLNPILVKTSSVSKGGVVSYAKIKPQLNKKCLEDILMLVGDFVEDYEVMEHSKLCRWLGILYMLFAQTKRLVRKYVLLCMILRETKHTARNQVIILSSTRLLMKFKLRVMMLWLFLVDGRLNIFV